MSDTDRAFKNPYPDYNGEKLMSADGKVISEILGKPWPRAVGVRCLPGMREVLGSNPLGGNILCSPSPLKETINRGPNTPITTTHALICEELKDPCITPNVVPQ